MIEPIFYTKNTQCQCIECKTRRAQEDEYAKQVLAAMANGVRFHLYGCGTCGLGPCKCDGRADETFMLLPPDSPSLPMVVDGIAYLDRLTPLQSAEYAGFKTIADWEKL